jgi:hypothetical protein
MVPPRWWLKTNGTIHLEKHPGKRLFFEVPLLPWREKDGMRGNFLDHGTPHPTLSLKGRGFIYALCRMNSS